MNILTISSWKQVFLFTYTDIDECELETDMCDPNHAVCTNNDGSYDCSCIVGFSGNGRTCGKLNMKSFCYIYSTASIHVRIYTPLF